MRPTERRPPTETQKVERAPRANPRPGKRAPAAAAPASDEIDDDPVPEDMDEFRDALARRIHRFVANRGGAKVWGRCPERCCRRHRVCLAPVGVCRGLPAQPPSTPEQRAEAVARFQRALQETLAARSAAAMGAGRNLKPASDIQGRDKTRRAGVESARASRDST